MSSAEFDLLRKQIFKFAEDRNMQEKDTPKNLAIALSIEASELLESFMWLKDGEKDELNEEQLHIVRNELADVFIYLIAISERLQIDLFKSAIEKMEINYIKYPTIKD